MPRHRATHAKLEADVAELEHAVTELETDLDSHTAADINADDLLKQLNASGSATIYVDLAGLSHDTVVTGGVHVEFDEVRQLFAVRRANSEELAEAEAAAV